MFSFDDITKIRYFLPEYNSKLSLVTIDLNRNSLRLNWTIPKLKSYQKSVGTATIDNLQQAFLKAQQIELDIKQGIFDLTLNKYGLGKDKPILAIVQNNITVLPNLKLPNIKELWEWYKSIQNNVVAESTKKNHWKNADHYLSLLPNECLEITNSDQLVTYLRSKKCNDGKGYADTTLKAFLANLSACLNLALSMGKIPKDTINSYSIWLDESKGLLKLPEKKKVQVYNSEQINLILQALANNTYCRKSATFKDNYYTNFVYFRFLTGLRPSECVALQWTDIVWDNKQPKQIIIRKRKTTGCNVEQGLKTTRKTKITARVIPCNKQLKNLILSIPKNTSETNRHNLLFPSIEGGYIDQSNFSSRQWTRVINGLVKDGLLPYFIPFYDERHCFGTHITRKGVDLKTTAAIMGNSPDTLVKNYLAVDDHPDFIPEI